MEAKNIVNLSEFKEHAELSQLEKLVKNSHGVHEALDNYMGAAKKLMSIYQSEIERLKSENKELKKQSNIDPLAETVYNRRFLEQTLLPRIDKNLSLENHRRQTGEVFNYALIFSDLVDFGMVNKNFGHTFGDEMIKQYFSVLSNNTREHDYVVRYGGDEALIVLEIISEQKDVDITHEEVQNIAYRKAQEIQKNLNEINLEARMGIFVSNEDVKSFKDMIVCADAAQRTIKKNKLKERILMYDSKRDEIDYANLKI